MNDTIHSGTVTGYRIINLAQRHSGGSRKAAVHIVEIDGVEHYMGILSGQRRLGYVGDQLSYMVNGEDSYGRPEIDLQTLAGHDKAGRELRWSWKTVGSSPRNRMKRGGRHIADQEDLT